MSNNPSVSIIVPVLNEEGSLEIFYREVINALQGFIEWEIIFIDDGSDDDSNKIIRRLANDESRVTLIQFFKNFGKSRKFSMFGLIEFLKVPTLYSKGFLTSINFVSFFLIKLFHF